MNLFSNSTVRQFGQSQEGQQGQQAGAGGIPKEICGLDFMSPITWMLVAVGVIEAVISLIPVIGDIISLVIIVITAIGMFFYNVFFKKGNMISGGIELGISIVLGIVTTIIGIIPVAGDLLDFVVMENLFGRMAGRMFGKTAVQRGPQRQATQQGFQEMFGLAQQQSTRATYTGAEQQIGQIQAEASQALRSDRSSLMGERETFTQMFEASRARNDQAGMRTAQDQIHNIDRRMQSLGSADITPTGLKKHFGIEGGKPMATICCVGFAIFMLFSVFVLAVYMLPENSPAGKQLEGARFTLNSVRDSLSRTLFNLVDSMLAWFRSQVTPCEVGQTGVACRLLPQRTCEPFCISPTGREAQWKGFEIKKLEVVPATVFDYQKFSVLAEFVNEGTGDSTFATVGEPTFGFFSAGGKLRCEWAVLGPFSGLIFWEPACRKVFPIQEGSSITTLTSGKCAKIGGEFEAPCTLEPGEVSQFRWFGFDIEEGVIRKGVTVKPDISISLDYFFLVPNDVVGSMAIQTFQEQLATSTVEKKEKRIVQKINRAYSPPGPLMIAMGTAEEQAISGIPALFLVQFANKGSGVVTQLNQENIKLYLPPEFEIYTSPSGEQICDFAKKWDNISQVPADQKDEWNPGPGFEKHVIYEPVQSLPEFGQTRNTLETPTLFCVLKTPKDVEKVKTYDFKMRITQYQYTESKRTRISIIGTALDITPPEGVPEEKTKSFNLGRCPLRDPIAGWCFPSQTLEFDQEYNVKEISVNAKHGGGWGCADANILIGAQNAAGANVPPPEKLLSAPNTPLGTTQPAPSQTYRGITEVFPESVKIKRVSAAVLPTGGFGIPCPYLDDITAVITYTE